MLTQQTGNQSCTWSLGQLCQWRSELNITWYMLKCKYCKSYSCSVHFLTLVWTHSAVCTSAMKNTQNPWAWWQFPVFLVVWTLCHCICRLWLQSVWSWLTVICLCSIWLRSRRLTKHMMCDWGVMKLVPVQDKLKGKYYHNKKNFILRSSSYTT